MRYEINGKEINTFLRIIIFCNRIRTWRPKSGVQGPAPPKAERNPAEGGCFASIYIYDIHIYIFTYHMHSKLPTVLCR